MKATLLLMILTVSAHAADPPKKLPPCLNYTEWQKLHPQYKPMRAQMSDGRILRVPPAEYFLEECEMEKANERPRQ